MEDRTMSKGDSKNMHTNRESREAGASTITTLIGSALGALVIGGFMLFWFTSDDSAQKNAEHSRQETSAVTVLNRAGRDVAEARGFVTNAPTEFVVEKVEATGQDQKVVRTRYAIKDGVDRRGKPTKVLVRQVQQNAPSAYSPGSFSPTSEQVLAHNVNATKTRFKYYGASGSEATSASEAGRVDMTYVAATKTGEIELKSSASVNAAIGGDGQRAGATGIQAVEDTISIVAGQTGTVDVLANDTYGDSPSVTLLAHSHPLNASVNASKGVQITPSASITSPTVYTLTYSLADENGLADLATIRVSVQVPIDRPAVTWSDICTTDGTDTYTIPARTGLRYHVSTGGGSAVEKSAGTHSVTGTSTRVVVTVKATEGYKIRYDGKFVDEAPAGNGDYTFDHMACALDAWASDAPTSLTDKEGANSIAWSGGFLEYRRTIGTDTTPDSSSTWTPLPSVDGQISGTATHKVEFGTRYEYRINKTRNRDKSGAFVTTSNDQYPKAPTISAAPNPAWSGRNVITSPAPTGIETRVEARVLQSFLSNGDVLLRQTGRVPLASSPYTEHQVGAGTETIYFGTAVSQCRTSKGGPLQTCRSWGGNDTDLVNRRGIYPHGSGIQRTYQAPAGGESRPRVTTGGHATADACFGPDGTRLVSTVAGGANNQMYHCASGRSEIRLSGHLGDHGQPATSKFCSYEGDPGQCHVRYQTQGGGAASTSHETDLSVRQTAWGAKDIWNITTCNVAGCSNVSTPFDMYAYPGTFEITGMEQPVSKRFEDFTKWYEGGCENGCKHQTDGEMLVRWSNSVGGGNNGAAATTPYQFQARREDQTWNNTRSVNTARAALGSGWIEALPARVYEVKVTAPSHNPPPGKDVWRRNTTTATGDVRVAASPPHVSAIQDAAFCRPSVNNAWRYGFYYKRQAFGPGGNDISASMPLFVRHMWWASKINVPASGNVGLDVAREAAQYWLAGSNDPANWVNPDNWTVNGPTYYSNSAISQMDRTWNQTLVVGQIPPTGPKGGATGAAHIRVEVFTRKSWLDNVHFADTTHWMDSAVGPDVPTDPSVGGNEVRLRADGINPTEVANCAQSSVNGHRFSNGNPNWYLVTPVAATRNSAPGVSTHTNPRNVLWANFS